MLPGGLILSHNLKANCFGRTCCTLYSALIRTFQMCWHALFHTLAKETDSTLCGPARFDHTVDWARCLLLCKNCRAAFLCLSGSLALGLPGPCHHYRTIPSYCSSVGRHLGLAGHGRSSWQRWKICSWPYM